MQAVDQHRRPQAALSDRLLATRKPARLRHALRNGSQVGGEMWSRGLSPTLQAWFLILGRIVDLTPEPPNHGAGDLVVKTPAHQMVAKPLPELFPVETREGSGLPLGHGICLL